MCEESLAAPSRRAEDRREPATLVAALRRRATAHPDRWACSFLADGERDERRLSYGALDLRARAVAARLQASGLGGERVLLLFPPGLEYAAALLGCFYAGAVAVPAYPPTGSRGAPRLAAILADCAARCVLTTAALLPALERLRAGAAGRPAPFALEIGGIAGAEAEGWRDPGVRGDDLALLQYTSGSTSAPKGVMISHGNLAANQAMIGEAFRTDADAVVVSWLPLYHDMGLIGGLLHPLWRGAHCVLFSPLHFLQRPRRWLEAIARFGASISGGPNFAYELCARKIAPDEAAVLDLSRWRVAFNGAEPVRADVLERFAQAFAPAGFRGSAFFPCYGLAEATLLVSGGRAGGDWAVLAADAAALAAGRAAPAAASSELGSGARRLVGCGAIPAGLEVRVAAPATCLECPAGEIGEVWVAGGTIGAGYWNRPEATAETFHARLADGRGPYLRTGDLGFVHGGELYIAGRIKDLILIRGRNLHPQDVEWTVERSHPAVRPGCGAAFAVEVEGEERLVVVQEVGPGSAADLAAVAAAIRQAVAEEHEARLSALVLVKPGEVPKTTSGKLRRGACRELFLSGGLRALGEWREAEQGEEKPGAAGTAPRGAMEERLAPAAAIAETAAMAAIAAIWEEVLDLAPGSAGAGDNFFALGGDSLRAAQLLARLREAAGAEVSLAELFAAPTLGAQAALAARLAAGAPDDPLARGERGRPLPLTSPQRRLWFLDQLEPGNPAYNLGLAVRFRGALDPPALGRALARIVRRHESLRTVFQVAGDAPAQVVRPADRADPPLPLLELAGIAGTAATPEGVEAGGAAAAAGTALGLGRELARLARELARRPFDLARGPLLGAHLVRLSPVVHELHLAVHHIVADGWSWGVLLRELAELYAAAVERRPAVLPELPVQYGDYAHWQERRLAGAELAAQLAACKRRLGGAPPVLALPSDRPRPAVRSYRGAHAVRLLPRVLAGGLRGVAGAHGASLFMVLAAGLAALLGRLTAEDDVIVGTAAANRGRVELEGLIGLFVNTLPLRADLGGDPSCAELLARVRAVVLAALDSREVPFERLVAELGTGRDPSVPPLVQVMLVLQNEPLEVPPVPGLTVDGREIDNGTARFDLALSLRETEEDLEAVFKYSRDLFDAPTVERLAGWFETLLEGVSAAPERRLSELELLGAAERQQLICEWNATAAPLPLQEPCLHELVAAQAERTPEAVAVSCEDASLSYRELDRRAGLLARHLRRLGVGPDALVGVAVERSLELMTGLLAVLKAAGAFVPLDPSYPAERLAFMAKDAGLEVLLASSPPPEWSAGVRTVIGLPAGGAGGAVDAGGSDGRPPVDQGAPHAAAPENLAYCIYTSGSTGLPKGAANTHRGIVNRLLWMQAEYGLAPGEGVLQKTPASFDVAVWELFWPLLAGARVVFARPGGHQDSAYLAEVIERQQITTLHFVPSMLQVFLTEPRLARLTSLRQVIASGEALPRELEQRFGRLLSAELHNLYGPTEAAVDVTSWRCLHEPAARAVPIGRPIANLRVHLLDAAGGPAPIGAPGHLHIGGAGLARGYWRRPGLTAERFVPDPFGGASSPGERLYATGDLARRRPDGAIEFLGRLDHQVKIRGVRIEPGEVEAALAAHPRVREAVVVARAGAVGGPRLVAYVAGHGGGAAPDAEELRRFLAARLPDPLLPALFVVLPALPLTPSGKVDRKALPAPAEHGRPGAAPYLPPRTAVEERLAAMWRELLGAERVGAGDDFFALGGDSIQGALFVNRLQRELAAVVYVMSLFDAPTVESYAAYLEGSYRQELVRAGWCAAAGTEEEAAGPAGAGEAAEIAALRRALAARFSESAPARRGALARRNLPAVFLLAPFRSGSTLLRVMLAGHPGLFAPPELELLGFATLGERRQFLSGRDGFAREGLLRAVMELRACDAEAAAALVAESEACDEPTPGFYRRLQEWAGGRTLVDKTPRYVLDLPTLRRAEEWFDEPLYIHLVRHPAATVESYLEARMHEVYRLPLTPRRQAELVWRLGHENTLEHLEAVPAARRHRIRFEELVGDPRAVMERLCLFLGIGFHPAVLSPYEGERMTGGLHRAGRMMGDPKFHQHRRIEAGVAQRWRAAPGIARLDAATWTLARRLGCEMPAAALLRAEGAAGAAGPRPAPRPASGGGPPLSFSQQRLWFLDRLTPGASVYNMPAAVRLTGLLDTAALARACTEVERRHEVLRTTFPSLSGRPRQVVGAPRPALLPVVDLSGLAAAAGQAEAMRLAGEEALRPFALASGPLWRVRLLRLAAAEHLLLVNLHHIVCDGWSVGVLTRELAALYAAFREGAPPPLPELPFQYADFAAWQRQRLAGALLADLLGYWKERLAGPLPVLDLPLDRPRPGTRTYRGRRFPVALPAAVVQPLKELGRREGTTLFISLAAIFQALLSRYTGQEDLLLGTPVASRNRAELEGLIGSFVNTLVLRFDLAGDPDFRTLMGRAREICLGAARHEELPFEKLVEELGVERSLGHAPLFSVLLVLQNAPPPALTLPGLAVERVELSTRSAKFDLTLDLAERREDGGLAGALEYDTDLFDRTTVARLAAHLATLMQGAAGAPNSRLSDLPLLADAERHQLVAGLNDSAAWFAPGVTVHDLFAATARRVPGAVAVSCEGRPLRYGELAARVERLAGLLAGLGVGPEVVVGIYAERSPAMLAAVLAVLAAGGAYVPLDPAFPPARVDAILADSGAALLLTEHDLAAGLPPASGQARVVLLDRPPFAGPDEDDEDEPAERAGPPPRRASLENLAYVIYTSGSTGRPKGVELGHRGLVNFLASTACRPGLGPLDVVMAVSSLAFDVAVVELLLPLVVGARIDLVRRATGADPVRLARAIDAAGATVLQATPTALTMLLDGGWQGRPELKVLCAGEAMPCTLAERLAPLVRSLWNCYGPTEATVYTTVGPAGADRPPGGPGVRSVPIGRPLANTTVHLLDAGGNLVPLGVVGELAIGGEGLARGYRGQPERTAESFIPDPFGEPGIRLYRSGDLARRLPDGRLDCLGRIDHQVKVRGFRVELGEIESVLRGHPAVGHCAVAVARRERPGDQRLVAYVVRAPEREVSREELRSFLGERLPAAMIPAAIVFLDRFPLLPSGKVDRKALPEPGQDRPELAAAYVAPRSRHERLVAEIWREALGIERVGIDDNFFDLGGHSLLAAEVHGKLRERLQADLSLLDLFRHSTVRALAGRLDGQESARDRLAGIDQPARRGSSAPRGAGEDVAIIGMAGRFPGAADLGELWRNLRGGVESIAFFTDAELLAAGVDPDLLSNPRYVRARGVLDGIERFDAAHFGFSPREAAITDPQQRLLLECAWEALEQAGLDPETFAGRIGIYAGTVISSYLLLNLLPNAPAPDESWQIVLANDKDMLATRISYKLNLRGPGVTVQTGCSTALVALHLARQALLAGECDAALAGGVSVRSRQTSGYLWEEGGILSPDGHCRPFDAAARGTVFGSGAGVVVLRRLADALADGDTVHAVIKSSAVNNDGSDKVGFMAPSVEGQAEVIARALVLGGIDPETVGYVETHGSATPLGDPIEVAALTRAFRAAGAKRSGYCAIGSVKSNFGHLDAAAGAAGLIKTVLALEHREIPASLHFERPNPEIDFAASPFFVNARLRPWQGSGPLRAGVSSFGIGGTNAHVILEEAPGPPPPPQPRPPHPLQSSWPLSLLVLSARSAAALGGVRARLRQHLLDRPEEDLADAAYTTQVGRRAFAHRQAVVAATAAEAAALLGGGGDPGRGASGVVDGRERQVAFLLPGLGEHYPGMAAALYRGEEVFRRELDRCAALLAPILSVDLRELLFPRDEGAGGSAAASRDQGFDLRRLLRRGAVAEDPRWAALTRTSVAQPALFAVEYALARLWMSWNVRPQALIGYSVGEYVAACLAGVLSLEDAAALIGLRARLIERLPPGRMLAVPMSAETLLPLLGPGLSLAAANGPSDCVVAGEPEAAAELERRLGELAVPSLPLPATHAFHSAMLQPAADELTAAARGVALAPPSIPYLSNLTGTWITAAETCDPGYWARHMCEAVRFAEGLDLLLADPDRILLEVGPGQALATLARRSPGRTERQLVLTSLRHRDERQPELQATLAALGRLWVAGVAVDWPAFHRAERRRRVPLPAYPFERRRHWVEPPRGRGGPGAGTAPAAGLAGLIHLPGWRRSAPAAVPGAPAAASATAETGTWLAILDRRGLGEAMARRLEARGFEVVRVDAAEAAGESAAALPARLRGEGRRLRGVLHLGSVGPAAGDLDEAWQRGFASLAALTRAMEESGEASGGVTLAAVATGSQWVTGQDEVCPAKATLLGWARTAPRGGGAPRCRLLDVVAPAPGSAQEAALADRLVGEVLSDAGDPVVAWRGPLRWVPSLEAAPLVAPRRRAAWLRPGGTYLLTGALSGAQLALARQLARAAPLRLALVTPAGSGPDLAGGPVRELEDLGAEVLAVAADLADAAGVQAVLDRVEKRWGPLHGVFFLPAAPGAPPAPAAPAAPAADSEIDALHWMRGALVLDRLLGDERPLDIFVLFSWLEPRPGPPLAGPARAELWAAGALLDALACARSARGARPAVAVGCGPGMDWASDEAFDLLDRVLAQPAAPQVVIALPPALQGEREEIEELPTPALAGPGLADASGDVIAARIAAIWREVLGVGGVGPHDRFVDLGGDSLAALRVVARVREAFAVELPARSLFERPTVAALRDEVAGALGAGRAVRQEEAGPGEAGDGLPPPFSRRTESGPAPLGFLQRQLWFLDQLDPESTAYNLCAQARLSGRLDRPALRRAVREIVARHEILRTVFDGGAGEPVQVVLADAEIDLAEIDLAALPPPRLDAERTRCALAAAGWRFDLARGPLARTLLVRLAPQEHLLVLSAHHIVYDGGSEGVLFGELGALYGAFASSAPSPLPPLPVQYSDFAAWQHRAVAAGCEGDLAYWRRQLTGAPAGLDLPADRPRPAVARFRGASRPLPALPPELHTALAGLASRAETTLFTALLAVLDVLLLRYGGQTDLLVGTPVSGRHCRELEGLIGPFINTVVLRGDLAGDPTFHALLGRLRSTVLAALDHQAFPFERVVEEVQAERGPGRNPLFQVAFAVHSAPLAQLALPGLVLRLEDLESRSSMFDLFLYLRERGGLLDGGVEFDTDLFDRPTAERLLGHYRALLAAAVESPDRPVAELPLLLAGESQQLLVEWSGGAPPAPEPRCLHRELEAVAEGAPEATAVSCEGAALSYGELNRRANALARHLRRLGVAPEVPVVVCLERSLELVVGLVAVLKAGGAYVPLDPTHPGERLRSTAGDALAGVEPPIVLTERSLAGNFAPGSGGQDGSRPFQLVVLDAPGKAIDARDGRNLPEGALPQGLAYVIYTSGTTGRPKGVLDTHANAARLFRATRSSFGFGPRDVWTLFHSAAFDFSVWELWGALLHGGRLVVVPYWVSRSPEQFHRLLVDEGVTVLNQTPSAFRQLAAADQEMAEDSRRGMALRLVVFGGEALDPACLASWLERHGEERPRLVNMYGITEATVHVTCRRLGTRDLAAPTHSPIGAGLEDLRLTVLDARGHPVPIGVAGELFVGGAGVARGYLGQPGLTAARFLPDPGSAEPGGRCYRSGDLARWRPAGGLDFLGRVDHQVKIRGVRIEPGEIEAVLAGHPAVRECVVVPRLDGPPAAEARLVAYVVPRAGGDGAELRGFLAARLPPQMVPAAFVTLDALPLTPSGKVDRRALPAPREAEAGSGAEVSPSLAADPIAQLVAGIWSEVLGRERVGIDDDFFVLGGHSLLATRVVSRLRGVLGVELTLRQLFAAPTVAQLAGVVRAARAAGRAATPPIVPLPPEERQGDLPASFAQQRLWLLDQIEPGSAAYNLPAAVRLRGVLAVEDLRRILAEVVRRHEALRTTLPARAAGPVQRIAPPTQAALPALPLVDLAGLPPGRVEELAHALAGAEARRPFDLQRGPLLRQTLLRLGEREHLLLMTLHHIVCDGWSLGVLLREIAVLAGALPHGLPAVLPELPVQYADFAVWQRRWLTGEVLERQLGYWKRQLAGAPRALDLPTDRPRSSLPGHRGGLRRTALPPALARAVAALCRRQGVTAFMALLGAWGALLGRQAGQELVLLGTPVAGRNRREIEELIGLFVNTLVLRVDLTGSPSFGEVLRRLRETALDAFLHQDLPFERLVEELAPERDLSRSPLFEVLFILQDAPLAELRLPGLDLLQVPVDTGAAKFDLTLTLGASGGGFAGWLEYDAELFDAATAERLLAHYERLLAAAVAEPELAIRDLPALSPAERQQVVVEVNDTAAGLPAESCVHELVWAQAARTPQAVAVRGAGRALRYGELAAQAGGLARRLVRLGVGPEVLVGVCAERTPALLVALLGVLEAGGAYVPLDPTHPRERLGWILADSRARVVLTERSLSDALPPHEARVVLLDEEDDDSEGAGAGVAAAPVPATAARAENLAYVIYTSGSTGRPKGVGVRHRGVVNYLAAMAARPGLGAGDVMLAVTTLSFDIAVTELLLPLSVGARVELVDRET
ncbi:MAG TPA: amino acid adenylation domain-containing protein, partial [Thermoanaerobaculia bacterium]|nr:amino acid adenylation domain-containing protein [Thermoanaerobaculia bacterium]